MSTAAATPQPPTSISTEPKASGSIIAYEDRLVNRQELARWLGVTSDCLSRWALQGLGPPALRIGAYKTAYKISDVLGWLSKQNVSGQPAVRRGGKRSTAAHLHNA